jgi:hypothetical protein
MRSSRQSSGELTTNATAATTSGSTNPVASPTFESSKTNRSLVNSVTTNSGAASALSATNSAAIQQPFLGPVSAVDPLAFINQLSFLKPEARPTARIPWEVKEPRATEAKEAAPQPAAAITAAAPKNAEPAVNPFQNLSEQDLAELIAEYETRAKVAPNEAAASAKVPKTAVDLAKDDGIDLERARAEYEKLSKKKAAAQPTTDTKPAATIQSPHSLAAAATPLDAPSVAATAQAAAPGAAAPLRVALHLDNMTTPELSALLQGYRSRGMKELGTTNETQATWDKATNLAKEDGIRLDELIDRINEANAKSAPRPEIKPLSNAETRREPRPPAANSKPTRRELNHKAVLNDFGRGYPSALIRSSSDVAPSNAPLSVTKMSTAQLYATVQKYGTIARETIQAQKGADYQVSFDEAMQVGAPIAARDGVNLAEAHREYMARPDRGAVQATDPNTVAAEAVRNDVASNPRSLEKKIRKQTPAVTASKPEEEGEHELYTSHSRGQNNEALIVNGSVEGMRRTGRKFLWFFPMKDKVTTRPGMTKAEFESKLAWIKEEAHALNVRAGLASPPPSQMQEVTQQPSGTAGNKITLSENHQGGTAPVRNG